MRIGELGEKADVSAKTIRYYEDIGILPEPARTPAGYRDYDAGALDRLHFIKAAQSVGFSLGEIREILAFRDRGEVPCRHVAGLIERHARDISEWITALEQMRRQLEALAERGRKLSPAPGTFCHIIEGDPRRATGRRPDRPRRR